MRFARRARLRIGLGPGLADLAPGSGHGNVWSRGLRALDESGEVKLVSGGRADVWLASGHLEPPDVAAPLVVHVHEIGWRDPGLREFLYPEFAEALEAATDAAVAAADHVISLSESTRRQVLEIYNLGPKRVHAVHPGVDAAVFKPGLEGGRGLVADALGRADQSPYVLYVGVLHPRKNYRGLREAVAGLARRGWPHVLAMVAGVAMDRPDASEFEREAEAPLPGLPGRLVRFANLDESRLATLLAGADVFCLPSFYEGFGLPALEAMACGTPVVVSDRGALPEVVGDAGVVVEPTPEAIEEALHRVLGDEELEARLREAGRARARVFTWARTAEGWLRVLRLAAEGRP